MRVAPYVGAWIETLGKAKREHDYKSHPTWVRGLKLEVKGKTGTILRSHPTWVRGLKHK